MDKNNQQVPPIQPSPSASPLTSPPSPQKTPFFLGGLLILLVISGVILYVTQKNKMQLSQKTLPAPSQIATPSSSVTPTTIPGIAYVHKFMKFTVTLPPDIVVIEESTQSATFVKRGTPTLPPDIDGYYTHDLMILYRGAAGTTPEEALRSETPIREDGKTTVTSVQATINNAVGLRTTSGFASEDNYYLTNKSYTDPVIRILLDFGPNDPDYKEFKSIIESVKFL